MGGGGGGYFSDGPRRDSTPPAKASSNRSYKSDDQVSTNGGIRTAGQGGGGGAAGGADPCNIRDAGSLRSPDPAVMATLQEGMPLGVVARDVRGVQVLVAVTVDGRDVGAIDCRREQDIIDCIGQGHRYAARIDALRGGAVSVGISRVGTP